MTYYLAATIVVAAASNRVELATLVSNDSRVSTVVANRDMAADCERGHLTTT